MIYYQTPDHCIALNAKVGSSSLARVIIKQFYGKADWFISTAKGPENSPPEERQWHHMVPTTTNPSKPIILFVRDPLQRFLSAMKQVGLKEENIDEALESLINDSPMQKNVNLIRRKASPKKHPLFKAPEIRPKHLRDNIHFFHQNQYIIGEAHCFIFPDHIKEMSNFAGITVAWPEINRAKGEKSKITENQVNIVEKYYQKDLELFKSIDHPGQIKRRPQCH